MDIILSIKPQFVVEIQNGNKKFEFRKSVFKEDINNIYIYSTAPVKKIIGKFTASKIIKDSPINLWNQYQEFSGISKKDFFEYYNKKSIGYAIEITNLALFKFPKDPYKMFPQFVPPQSYMYVNRNKTAKYL